MSIHDPDEEAAFVTEHPHGRRGRHWSGLRSTGTDTWEMLKILRPLSRTEAQACASRGAIHWLADDGSEADPPYSDEPERHFNMSDDHGGESFHFPLQCISNVSLIALSARLHQHHRK